MTLGFTIITLILLWFASNKDPQNGRPKSKYFNTDISKTIKKQVFHDRLHSNQGKIHLIFFHLNSNSISFLAPLFIDMFSFLNLVGVSCKVYYLTSSKSDLFIEGHIFMPSSKNNQFCDPLSSSPKMNNVSID